MTKINTYPTIQAAQDVLETLHWKRDTSDGLGLTFKRRAWGEWDYASIVPEGDSYVIEYDITPQHTPPADGQTASDRDQN
jgi:hypothetical protein